VIDRSLLILLLTTICYIFFVKPHADDITYLKNKIIVAKNQIAAQETIKSRKNEIEKLIKQGNDSTAINESFFFTSEQSDSIAMVSLQDFVKNAAKNNKIEVLNSNWGVPFNDVKNSIVTLPIIFTVRGYPADVNAFLRILLFSKRFLKVEKTTITRSQDQLNLNMMVVAFKRANK